MGVVLRNAVGLKTVTEHGVEVIMALRTVFEPSLVDTVTARMLALKFPDHGADKS